MCLTDDCTQGATIEFLVVRDDELREWIIPPQYDVASFAPLYDEPCLDESVDALPP